MNQKTSPSGSLDSPRDWFATTRWSLVVVAADRSSADSERALAELCRMYWFPLYAYVRRRGHSREDAEDLTQSFFAHFLARNDLARLEAERGRFRAYLLAALKHFLANEWDRRNRLKRGGGVEHVSWDWESAEERLRVASPGVGSPDQHFDREWALALLERVIGRLKAESKSAGRSELFEVAQAFLPLGPALIPYAAAAESLGLEEGAVRVMVHRLRKRYRQLLHEEIADTLTDPGEVAEELRSLRAALTL
jgi:RNA polymerase sigma-70 factor (ECF subfamily)